MREHAKEPWDIGVVLVFGYNVTAVLDRDGDEICNMGTSLLDEDANARRIVACVNACHHLTTEQIESGEISHAAEVERLTAEHNYQMAGAYNNAVRQIAALKAERDAAVRERDAAVETLKEVLSTPSFGALHTAEAVDTIKKVRATLAKIEGGRG